MKTVNSYGIACVRKREEYEILMVRRKCTYAFVHFVLGHYNSNFDVGCLLKKMTIIEKNIILYGDFDNAYFHAFTRTRARISNKIEIRNYDRLEKLFKNHVPDKLEKMLSHTENGRLIWEFPKGRKQESENDLQSAMREFEEETGIVKYNILYKTKPFTVNIQDCGTNYKYMIYAAVGEEEPVYDANIANIEVSEIAWIPSSCAKYYLSGETLNIFKMIIKVIKKQKELLNVPQTEIERDSGKCIEEGDL